MPNLAREWLIRAGSALLIIGCGGTTITDDRGGTHSESGGLGNTGGSTGGSGHVGSGGSGHVGSGGSGNAASGGVGNAGSGGATCYCPAIACGPGSLPVSVPGQCCPICEPSCAAVDCAFPACKPGETPATPPGQCCPICQPVPVDAGPICTPGYRPEACHENDYPRCAPNWQTAQDLYSTVWCDAFAVVRLERCGAYDALVTANSEGDEQYLYDSAGTMVGYVAESWGMTTCMAYDPSFVLPKACAPIKVACTAQDGGTGATCGDGVIESGESCDGAVPAGVTCATATMGLHFHGSVRCTVACQLDVSECSS